jgi:hypothetical protein
MSKKENKPRNPRARENDELSVLSRISRLLEILVRLNLENMRGSHSQAHMIEVLDSVGCRQSKIADLLGTTSNTVNVALYKAKKKSRKK